MNLSARFYGSCPLPPGSVITLARWFQSTARIVLLEFVDQSNITWTGPEYPRDLAGGERIMELRAEVRRFVVRSTKVNSIDGWTDLLVEECE